MHARLLLGSALLVSIASAQVHYTAKVNPTDNQLEISMAFKAKAAVTRVQMPRWAPGAYVLSVPGRNVRDVVATSAKGENLVVTAVDESTWDIATKRGQSLVVRYHLARAASNDTLHWSGPSTYLYVDGRKNEACPLTLALPDGWLHSSGLDATGPLSYASPDYDTLADNPVSVGKILVDTYTVSGVPHEIVYQSGVVPQDLDRKEVVRVCKQISEAMEDFWGGFPFTKYVWHFRVSPGQGGGGGLEHLSSTEISFAAAFSNGAKSVLAHELFHAWNVKRIRSSVLGPFDYTRLPQTGALWWLEGVTDYYASLLLSRYEILGPDFFMSQIMRNTNSLRANKARLEISPFFSSFRVREAAGRRGNSNGYKISYYTQGWIVGLLLDTELRTRTGGKKSLDDLCQILWKQCRNGQPGFAEGDIRMHLVFLGGQAMGDFYDKVVMEAGEAPIEEALAKMGLQIKDGKVVDLAMVPGPVMKLRHGWLTGGRAAR